MRRLGEPPLPPARDARALSLAASRATGPSCCPSTSASTPRRAYLPQRESPARERTRCAASPGRTGSATGGRSRCGPPARAEQLSLLSSIGSCGHARRDHDADRRRPRGRTRRACDFRSRARRTSASSARPPTARPRVELAERRKPDVVIMDVRMPGMDGLEATKLLTERVPETEGARSSPPTRSARCSAAGSSRARRATSSRRRRTRPWSARSRRSRTATATSTRR